MENMEPMAQNSVLNYTLRKNLVGHTNTVHSLKFSPNGQWLASASGDSSIKMWNVSTGQLEKNILGHHLSVNDIAWSSDNSLLASASDDKTVKIWDVQRGKLLKTMKGHTNFVAACSFNPQMTLVASASFDETVRIWDRHTGNIITITPKQGDPINSVLFFKNGSLFASGSFNGLCSIWKTASTKCVAQIQNSYAPITNLKILPGEKWLLIMAVDDSIKLWNPADLSLKMYNGHINQIYHITPDYMVTPTGSIYIVSGSEDKLIYIWNFESQAVIQKLEGHNSAVVCTECHPTQEIIASTALEGDEEGNFPIKIWKNQ